MTLEQLQQENADLRRKLELVTGVLSSAYAALERDGDEWGICGQISAALAAGTDHQAGKIRPARQGGMK